MKERIKNKSRRKQRCDVLKAPIERKMEPIDPGDNHRVYILAINMQWIPFSYLKQCYWKGVMNFSSLDFIWYNIFAHRYIQVAIHESQELGNYLQFNTHTGKTQLRLTQLE